MGMIGIEYSARKGWAKKQICAEKSVTTSIHFRWLCCRRHRSCRRRRSRRRPSLRLQRRKVVIPEEAWASRELVWRLAFDDCHNGSSDIVIFFFSWFHKRIFRRRSHRTRHRFLRWLWRQGAVWGSSSNHCLSSRQRRRKPKNSLICPREPEGAPKRAHCPRIRVKLCRREEGSPQ